MSHYDYLEQHLDLFWQKVFGKTLAEMYMGGIVTAHGDKGYQYQDKWEDVDIPFERGMMLYMLTYTEKLDRAKHESDQWVIDNYEKYLPIIQDVEKEVNPRLGKPIC